ncbi:unnamed protein product, partial [marine sediment metagenome]
MAIKTFTVPMRGVGKPDYSREVSAGRERAGIALKHNQYFRAFGGNWTTGDPEYPLIQDYNIAGGGQEAPERQRHKRAYAYNPPSRTHS